MMLMIDVWCLVFDVKFDVDVAGKPEATFNLWAKGQNECRYHSPKFGDNYLWKLAAIVKINLLKLILSIIRLMQIYLQV